MNDRLKEAEKCINDNLPNRAESLMRLSVAESLDSIARSLRVVMEFPSIVRAED